MDWSKSECILAKIGHKMIRLLVELTDPRHKSALIKVIDKLGVCSCVSFDALLETLVSRDKFYFNNSIASTVFEFLFMLIETTPASGPVSSRDDSLGPSSKRKSIFLPLLVNQSLVSAPGSSAAASSGPGSVNISEAGYNRSLIKRISEILEALDERALLVSRYLVHSLKHYTRFIKVFE